MALGLTVWIPRVSFSAVLLYEVSITQSATVQIYDMEKSRNKQLNRILF